MNGYRPHLVLEFVDSVLGGITKDSPVLSPDSPALEVYFIFIGHISQSKYWKREKV